MRYTFSALVLVLLLASVPAFADIAVDPCEGATAGAACTLGDGGTGECTDVNGTLTCQAPAATNNGTNSATNNDTSASNNATAGPTTNGNTTPATPTTGGTDDKKGCSTAGAGELAPSLLVLALAIGLRRRRAR